MINPFLKARLLPVWKRHQHWQSLLRLTIWLVMAAIAGGAAFYYYGSQYPLWAVPVWLGTAVVGLAVLWLIGRWTQPDFRSLAHRIESRQPALDGRLLTAVQVEDSDEPAFIKDRLLQQTIQHSLDHDWNSIVTARTVTTTWAAFYTAVLACLTIFFIALKSASYQNLGSYSEATSVSDGIEVTPGDATIERGTSLLVIARFTNALPPSAELVTGNTPETERRQFLVRSLNDPVFGASIPEVKDDFRYRIDHEGKRTRDFSVTVFEYPRLERLDITLAYPAWTGLSRKRIEDTQRAIAVEGTKLAVDLQLNKPVASALLKARTKDAPSITLSIDPAKATATLRDFTMVTSQVYDLILTDAEFRTNQVSASLTLDVLPNKVPELKLNSPRGDQRPSPLEELAFEGTAWDDFGLLAWGIAITQGGGEAHSIELGKHAPSGEKRAFHHMLRLEEALAKPDDLLSWFVWADDIGPDGKLRRTQSDLFFGEVRAFDEIYRQGEDAAGDPPPGSPPLGNSPAAKLTELQKQIINATWKLLRAASPPIPDIKVVRESQADALEQATEAASEATDARIVSAWETAKAAMTKAGEALQAVIDQPASFNASLAAEQSAYQALLALQSREHRISKSKSKGGPPSAAEQKRQEEFDQLDLTNEENRYETKSEAETPQDAGQREQRQVLSRLQELAKRQEEVNEKLKELQTALQAAASEALREEIKRELKRLEDEQREMLADVDELGQRMEKPENQQKMAQEKKALEEARKNVLDASQATAEGNVPKALASGTRAERQLQEMREDLRKKSSTALSQDLRDIRAEARELASQQQKVTEKLNELENPKQKLLSDSPEREAAQKQLTEQKQRTERLTKIANSLSEEAENAEPLVSRQLYDTMRKFAQEDAAPIKETQQKLINEGRMTQKFMNELAELQQSPDSAKTLGMTSGLLEQDLMDDAIKSSTLAGTGIDNLKKGIEQATESVLGDDTEALKRADRELASLTEELEREMARSSEMPSDAATQEQGNVPAQAVGSLDPEKSSAKAASQSDVKSVSDSQRSTTASNSPGEEKTNGKGEGEGEPRASEVANNEGRGQGKASGEGQSSQAGGSDLGSPNERGGNQTAGGRGGSSSPIAGDGYAPWTDRLRDVEEMVDFPDLRNSLANARERARQMRVEAKRDLKKPDWAVVKSEILHPLVQVRQQVREEVARRASSEAMVPIDRDPVPGRYSELVRRYYEQLGKDP